MPSPLSSKKSSTAKAERKSLKDKMMDNDLTNFLKERRAVSESRFRTLDKGQRVLCFLTYFVHTVLPDVVIQTLFLSLLYNNLLSLLHNKGLQ